MSRTGHGLPARAARPAEMPLRRGTARPCGRRDLSPAGGRRESLRADPRGASLRRGGRIRRDRRVPAAQERIELSGAEIGPRSVSRAMPSFDCGSVGQDPAFVAEVPFERCARGESGRKCPMRQGCTSFSGSSRRQGSRAPGRAPLSTRPGRRAPTRSPLLQEPRDHPRRRAAGVPAQAPARRPESAPAARRPARTSPKTASRERVSTSSRRISPSEGKR